MKALFQIAFSLNLILAGTGWAKGPMFSGKYVGPDHLNPQQALQIEFALGNSPEGIQPGTQPFVVSCNLNSHCQYERMTVQGMQGKVEVLKNLLVNSMQYSPAEENVWVTDFVMKEGTEMKPAFKVVSSTMPTGIPEDTLILIFAGSGRQVELTRVP